MPEIDIEKCVKDSIEIFCSTPRSVTYRQHEPVSTSPKGKKNFWDISLISSSAFVDDTDGANNTPLVTWGYSILNKFLIY